MGNGNGNIPLSYLESYNFNYTTPNTYSPYLTCALGNTSVNSPASALIVNGGTAPALVIENGFVTCTNCANQDNVNWIIDGTLLIDSLLSIPDSLGQFFSCDYMNEFGCTANSFVLAITEEINNSFKLFPNPTRDVLNVSGLLPASTIEIRDTQGRLIFRELGKGKVRIIDTTNFSNGIYTISESSNNILRSGTLLVNH
ncbi:MAG: T9SS type A sorting domain-containing protein [Sediminibacterium sp.]